MQSSLSCRKEQFNATSIPWHVVQPRRPILRADARRTVVAANGLSGAAPVPGSEQEPPRSRRELAARLAATNPRPRSLTGGSHPLAARRSRSTATVARRSAARTAVVRPAVPRSAATRTATARPAPLQRTAGRRLLRRLMSVGAMLGAAALLVSTSLPANAFFTAPAASSASITTESVPTQRLQVDGAVAIGAPTRDAYTVVSLVQKIATTYASAARDSAYTNDPNGTIQWPFPVAVPIASGFGPRQVAGCGFCSTFHEGVDFTPGSGVPIQAIADGVVSKVEFDSGGLGNNVTIDHVIAGQKVQSVYGHMMTGTVRVVVGEAVKVTDVVGQVGSTGASTGAHLHLEIHLNGTPVDPFVWLKANAN